MSDFKANTLKLIYSEFNSFENSQRELVNRRKHLSWLNYTGQMPNYFLPFARQVSLDSKLSRAKVTFNG
jgi:hypothetical protein